MSASTKSLRRESAEWMVRMMPLLLAPEEAEWGRAIAAEVSAIGSDREALRWAIGSVVGTYARQVGKQLKRPSAFLPLLMSFSGIGMVVAHVILYGIVRDADEGTPAHVFQLLMVGQLPLVAVFAVRRLPEAPVATMNVLLLQAAVGCCAVASVLLFT